MSNGSSGSWLHGHLMQWQGNQEHIQLTHLLRRVLADSNWNWYCCTTTATSFASGESCMHATVASHIPIRPSATEARLIPTPSTFGTRISMVQLVLLQTQLLAQQESPHCKSRARYHHAGHCGHACRLDGFHPPPHGARHGFPGLPRPPGVANPA